MGRFWDVTYLFLLFVVVDVVIDIYHYPTIRNCKQRREWWWNKLRFLAYWLASALGFLSWAITWPVTKMFTDKNSTKEAKT